MKFYLACAALLSLCTCAATAEPPDAAPRVAAPHTGTYAGCIIVCKDGVDQTMTDIGSDECDKLAAAPGERCFYVPLWVSK